MFKGTGFPMQLDSWHSRDVFSRKIVIAVILGVALIAFEIFNFDTTQFALTNLLGEISFAGVLWASILAIAFCAIDFAGLVRIFTPQRGLEEPKAVWFLTGAWFLGTIANSVMTWWAVSLTLLSHEFGNEVLSREALLRYVPIFVAMLVWLTRILFIGAFSVAGGDVFELRRDTPQAKRPNATNGRELPTGLPVRSATSQQSSEPTANAFARSANQQPRAATQPKTAQPKTVSTPDRPAVTYEPVDDPFDVAQVAPKTNGTNGPSRPVSRIQQRPPMPGGMGRTPATGSVQARSSKSGH